MTKQSFLPSVGRVFSLFSADTEGRKLGKRLSSSSSSFSKAALSTLRMTDHFSCAPFLHRKDKLDHMLVPIKTLTVGLQELHHKSWKSLMWRGNSCIKDHFYNVATWQPYIHTEHFKLIFFCLKKGCKNFFLMIKKVIK